MQTAPLVPDAPPGTTAYLPGLMSRIRAAHPDLPLEPVILQSLLICLIAQSRQASAKPGHSTSKVGLHLILRTKEEDVGLVVNLVALTLQHALGVFTHKHKAAPKVATRHVRQGSKAEKDAPKSSTHLDDTNAFLRSLFFRRAPHTSFSSHRSSTPKLRSGASSDTTPRPGSTPLAGQSKSSRSFLGHPPKRSSSFPAPSTDGEDDDKYFDAASMASSRRPLLGQSTPMSTMRSRASKGRPGAHRLRTDPLPLSTLFATHGASDAAEADDLVQPLPTSADSVRFQNEKGETNGPTSAMPKAVVVSGLENTTTPSQRALMRVLAERRVVFDGNEDEGSDFSGRDRDMEDGTWNLPEDFLLVYVCKLDPHERPAILGGLVDKFSMSADISLQPAIRQGYLAYRASHTPTPRGTPIASPSALPHTTHSFFSNSAPAHHSPARRTTPLPAPTPQAPPALSAAELTHLRTLARPFPTAAPIFYPSVHATVQASISFPLSPRPPPYAALHPSLDMYLLDLFAATRHHPALDGTLLTMRAHADAEALARAFRVLHGDTVGADLVYQEARMGDHETAAGTSLDAGSWAWRSADSLRAHGNGDTNANAHGNGLGVGPGGGSDYSLGGAQGVRLRIDDSDGGSHRSYAGFDAFLDGPPPEVSPADMLDSALAGQWPEVWDVSEEDVARVFPRVVSHRLRVRDGPDDEVLGSVMWPAVPVDMSAQGGAGHGEKGGVRMGWERKSVKEILVRILADV